MIENVLKPIVDDATKVLILGSMPGVISLQKQQYYGNDRNHFWGIMSALFEQHIPETYEEKLALLKKHHIGLWDTIESCERKGSLDSAIKSEVPNDFHTFFNKYPQIELVLFNGGKAEMVFKKYMDKAQWPTIRFEKMPSTSPVPGRNVKSFEEKIISWQELLSVI